VGAIANSLIFSAGGAPLLVMTSGAHRVSESRVAALVGASAVGRADARSVREWTGQAIGGVAPVGHPAPIRTLVDTWLDKYDVVWAAAGHPHTVFPTSFAELIRITGGTPADVGALLRCAGTGGCWVGAASGEAGGEQAVSAADVEGGAAAGRDRVEDDGLVVDVVIPIAGPSHHGSRVRRIPLGLCVC
jgi:prolyl-tRNA editing enzyme YbaK/EbsC (Cys-tRNA(Pro) deacylase)